MERAYVSHRTPRRVRLKVPGRRGDASFFRDLTERLADRSGVVGVDANPTTGSVLVRHDGTFALSEATGLHARLHVEAAKGSATTAFSDVRRQVAALDLRVRAATSGEVDLATLGFVALAAIAVIQLLRGNVAVPAATALWYAAELARVTAQREQRDRAGREAP